MKKKINEDLQGKKTLHIEKNQSKRIRFSKQKTLILKW